MYNLNKFDLRVLAIGTALDEQRKKEKELPGLETVLYVKNY